LQSQLITTLALAPELTSAFLTIVSITTTVCDQELLGVIGAEILVDPGHGTMPGQRGLRRQLFWQRLSDEEYAFSGFKAS
jgi:hypothetical protein